MQVRLANVAKEATAESGLTVTAERFRPDLESDMLRQAAQEFEAIFINHMLSTMRRAVSKSDLIPSSMATDVFEEMLDEEIAAVSASAGGMGLANMLLAQLGASVYDPK